MGSDNQVFIVHAGIDMEFQDTLIATSDYLHKSYITSRNLLTDEWPPYQPRHYTTLALIHHKDKCTDATVISVTQELAVAGKIQPIVEGLISPGSNKSQAPNIYTNATKNISDIFVSVTASDGVTINPCIVLIEGAPGIGKTVLAKEITFQWAYNKILNDKRIVFLVFLRQCNFKSMVSVESFVQYSVQSSKIAVSLTKYLLQTEGKELAIVFDGYDEISSEDRYDSIVAKIIHRKIFAKCCLVITSRPTASSDLHSIVDCRVEILGFTEEDRLDYIQTALQGDDDKVEALTIYLQSNPTINALCYIPLNMTILLCLVEDGIDKLPKTQTDMYKKFIEMTIKRFIKKVDVKNSEVITNITRLPCPYNKVFEELTGLAYNALKIDKIVFKLNEIEEVCPNIATISSNWNGLGLLKAVQRANAELGNVTFHFLHFSIQEYMAALYISTLSIDLQIKLLKETFWIHRYYNTWIMYVGITCGSSFALRHFLSGNLFQFTTKYFKTSSISNKYLKDKIKCLHLFQCLIESNNQDMLALVSRFFQGDKIDLSNQTLLPNDVNTLAFFLMRSINKRCELLDISGCNIGNTGIKILCDRFSDQESREIMMIKKVNFSYNNLNFSSLVENFDLFKSWHTSELVIKDSEIFQDCRSSDIYKFITDAFFLSSNNKVSLELGPFLLGYKINGFTMLFDTTSCITSIYLINCTLRSVVSSSANLNLREIHLINTYLPDQSLKVLCNNLLKCSNPCLFVYNAELPDQDADKIYSMLSSKMTNGIMLVISRSKIQGIIDTFNICEQLTKLEVLNLSLNVNQKFSDDTKVSPWKENFYDNNNSDLIKNVFIEMFCKINRKRNSRLRILLNEKDVLIAHKVNCECISEKIKSCVLKGIYLNECDIRNDENQILLDVKKTLTHLYILYSYTKQSFLMILNQNLLLCKEMFIHTLYDVSIEEISNFRKDCSTVFITKNQMFACNPTTKQIALALQLEPSINVLKLLRCQENFDCFNQIIAMLTIMQNNWTELDFMNCKLGEIDYEFLQRHLKNRNSTIKMLKVSSYQLTKPLIRKFLEIVLIWKVQHLLFYDISQTVYDSFITRFITTTAIVSLLVSHNGKKDLYFCNYNWNQITSLLEGHSYNTVYCVNCHFSLQAGNLNTAKLCHISELRMINCAVYEDTIVSILEVFTERQLKISIYYLCMHVDNTILYNFITSKKLLYQSQLSFVAMMKNLTCGFNTTEEQLQFLRSQNLSDLEYAIVASLSNFQQIFGWKELFVFQNKQLTALHYVGEASQTRCITELITILKKISTLKFFGIDMYTISGKLAIDIASALSHNKKLEQLYFNSKLEVIDLLNILEVLSQKFKNLKVFEISNNSITEMEIKYLISLISHNLQLQYFNITNGNLSTTNVAKMLKALRTTVNLQELTISGCSTKVVNDLTAFTSNNSELYQDDNNVQTIYIKLLAKHLQRTTLINFYNKNSKNVFKIAEDLQSAFVLKELCITNNIGSEIVNDLVSSICNCTLSLRLLEVFNVSNSNLQSGDAVKIAKALQNLSTLTKLYISNSNVTNEAVDGLAAVICKNIKLQEFDVSKNHLQSEGAIKIAKALQNISTLTKLYINDNHITDTAADDIITALSCNTQLQELDISNNWFQVTGVVKITKSLENFTTLKKLCISDNHIMEEAADNISGVICMNTLLQELDVSKIGLQSKGVIKIATALQNVSTLTKLYINTNGITVDAADDIVNALSCNIHLQELDISNNFFGTVGVIRIAKALLCISTLKKLYMSNNHITDKAANDINIALSHNSQLQKFDISGNNLQTKGIMKIAKALQNISTLTMLNISKNNITEEAVDDIIGIVYHNAQLQQLNIGFNRLSWNGIARITVALCKGTDLRALQIENNKISDTDKHSTAQTISLNAKLESFNCSDNHFSTGCILEIIKALQNISTLTKLYISNSNVTNEAVDGLAAVINKNVKLQELDVSKNNLQSKGAIKIAKALQNISALTKLYINDNHITDTAADDIITVLSCNTQLQELDISNNWFQVTGIVKVIKSLENFTTLRKLCISDNNIIEEAADNAAVVICMNTQLQELDVSKIGLQSKGVIKIATALQNVSTLTKLYINTNGITVDAADDIVNALSCNICLQELDISNNFFGTEGIVKIAKALLCISTLKKLYMSNNHITDKAANDINIALFHNSKLQEFDISKNNLQTKGIMKIAKALQNISTLTMLNISKNNITEEAVDDIIGIVYHNAQLQQLNIGFNRLSWNGIARITVALCKGTDLRALQIDIIKISDTDKHSTAQTISLSAKLESFNCSDNNFSTGCILEIIKALQNISTLTKLYISNCNVTSEAVDDLAAVINKNVKLQELDVSKNNLQSKGAIMIAKALQNISTLTKLYINDNHITDTAADDIITALSCNTQLQELDISNNWFQVTGIVKITKSLENFTTLKKLCISDNNIMEEAADNISGVICMNTLLQELDVSNIGLQSKGVIKIATALQNVSTLTKLYISTNGITVDAVDDIVNALSCNIHLQELDISNNFFGTVGVIRIAKALLCISTLKKL